MPLSPPRLVQYRLYIYIHCIFSVLRYSFLRSPEKSDWVILQGIRLPKKDACFNSDEAKREMAAISGRDATEFKVSYRGSAAGTG